MSSDHITAFISYSHDSEEQMNRLSELCNRLRSDGIDAVLDRYQASPLEGWARWTQEQISKSDFVLVVCTKHYARRSDGSAEPEAGIGANWEEAQITQDLYESAGPVNKIIPVLFSSNDIDHIPTFLRGLTFYDLSSEDGYEQVYRRMTNQPGVVNPQVGRRIIDAIGQARIRVGSHIVDVEGAQTPLNESARTDTPIISSEQAFDRIGLAIRQNLDQMKQNFDQARSESRQFFKLTIVFASLGFIIVLIGVILLFFGQITAGVFTSGGSMIPEIAAALFFKKDSELRSTIQSYHEHLLESQRTLSMIDVCETIVDPAERDRMKQEIIITVLHIKGS